MGELYLMNLDKREKIWGISAEVLIEQGNGDFSLPFWSKRLKEWA